MGEERRRLRMYWSGFCRGCEQCGLGAKAVSTTVTLQALVQVQDTFRATLPKPVRMLLLSSLPDLNVLLAQMTSSVEITLWGGLPAVKKEVVVGTFLPYPISSIIVADAPAQTFFNALSACRSTRHLFSVIQQHYVNSRHPNNTQSLYAFHYHDPMEYHVTEVHEPHVRGVTLGKCFGVRLDREDPEEPAAIFDTYRGQYTWLTA